MRDYITTDRLELRPVELRDAARIAQLGNERDIARMTATMPSPHHQLAAEFWVMQVQAGRRRGFSYTYAITLIGDDQLIGAISLFTNASGNWLGKPYWGQGLLTQAASALLAQADEHFGCDIDAGCYSDNPASIRVLEKLGFALTGETDNLFSMARLKAAPGVRLVRKAGIYEPQRRAS